MADANPAQAAPSKPKLVPGRSCGSCSLCCKVMAIPEVESPAGEWCRHCRPGNGCGLYPNWPPVCRDFFCMWQFTAEIGPHWYPAKSKMVLCSELNGARIAAHVDKNFPGAWRRSPYYEDLKQWSALAVQQEKQVSVWIGMHAIVILPDRDVDLGMIAADEVVVSLTRMTPTGPVHDAKKLKRSEAAEQEKAWAAARRKLRS
jgi:hypothetical protein